jgi:hypothetical protein
MPGFSTPSPLLTHAASGLCRDGLGLLLPLCELPRQQRRPYDEESRPMNTEDDKVTRKTAECTVLIGDPPAVFQGIAHFRFYDMRCRYSVPGNPGIQKDGSFIPKWPRPSWTQPVKLCFGAAVVKQVDGERLEHLAGQDCFIVVKNQLPPMVGHVIKSMMDTNKDHILFFTIIEGSALHTIAASLLTKQASKV